MEKLKIFLAALKRQHFWVLGLVVVLLGVIAWSTASGTLSEEFDKNSSSISSLKDELDRIRNTSQHPNDAVLEEFQARNTELQEGVRSLWQKLYDRQRTTVLFWPRALGSDFIDRINKMKFADTENEIPINFRERYQNYVRERFEELPDIVDAQKISERQTNTGREGAGMVGEGRLPMEDVDEKKYTVTWNGQELIQQKLVWEETPSSLTVWVTQEDLWVYETLLLIIQQTNEEVMKTSPHPAVSVIEALEVGREASPGSVTTGRVLRVTGSEPGAGGREEMSAPTYSGGEQELSMGRYGGEGGPGGPSADDTLLDGRYLKADGTPRPASEENDTPEFKRLPVRMVLEMDEQAIPLLLAQCGSAPLPVEVRQVRVNQDRSARGRSGGGSMRGGEEGGAMAGGQTTTIEPKVQHETVTIQGIIYIFNPPDKEKLGITDEQLAAAEAPAAATEPAATEPAATEPAAELAPAAGDPIDEATGEPAAAPAAAPADGAAADPAAEPAAAAGDLPAEEPVAAEPAAAPAGE
ncbi:MAG: hypothetical protein KDA42_06470 [Planctomycetales bacterium]|nr:hypothetical protein [Planctomycetales bacterium]